MDRTVDRGIQGGDGEQHRGPASGADVAGPGGAARARGQHRALEDRPPRPGPEPPPSRFETPHGPRAVGTAIGVLNLEGFGLGNDHPALGPAGALVGYATDNLRARPENLRSLQEDRSGRTLLLDPATLRNLEVL